MSYSFTEENYLKIIYHLSKELKGDGVSTNALAEMSATKAASVSDMLRKLSDKQLVNYQKYQGVTLTSEGQKVALKVIRKHRLWEVFLVDKLNFTWDEVHHIAEELEHINSEKLIEKLDEFLGYPKFDPHGDPIPDHTGAFPSFVSHTLTDLSIGQSGLLLGVTEHSTSFLKYLAKVGLTLGCAIKVADLNEYDQSVSVIINETTNHFLSREVAKNLLITLKTG
jgi:DtxR family transcriptional regulator, Mn-dependent transcriptional regulator